LGGTDSAGYRHGRRPAHDRERLRQELGMGISKVISWSHHASIACQWQPLAVALDHEQ